MSFQEYGDLIVAFVRDHKPWAAPIVAVLAFGESLAFVSLVLPFWGILVALGALVAPKGIDFLVILTAAATGAALGDWLSVWLGYQYHDQSARMWPLSRYPDLLPRGHAFFQKWGPWAIIIGRFSGPLRASVPIAAGAAQMAVTPFQVANWSSAVLWAAVLLLLGDGVGRALATIWSWF